MHKYVTVMLLLSGLPRVAPIGLQSVGVANPSMKEPVRVAITALAVIVQSSTQNEDSNVVHNDGVANEYMSAVRTVQVRSPMQIVVVLQASVAHQSKGITMIN